MFSLRVNISPFENGFTVNWISVTKRANGKLKRKEYSINFLPTRRENIFRSGERKDFFGTEDVFPARLFTLQGRHRV